jgi:hypothetical protein
MASFKGKLLLKKSKLLEWGKLASITAFSQALIQAIGLISGVFIIRILPTREYAFYTLANTMLGTMTILADSGIGTGVMAQGGKIWQDKEKLGVVLATGLNLRKKFAIGSLIISVPILMILLHKHHASLLMSFFLVVAIIPAFFTTLSHTILEIAPKLRQDITPLQKNLIGVSIGRLLMLVSTLFIFPWAAVAIIGSGVPMIWANIKLRKISSGYADYHQKPDPEVSANIIKIVKRLSPTAIYYCASSQIGLWLISFFGSTAAVAQIGALGRLSIILTLFSVLYNTIVAPRFARLPDKRAILFARYMQTQISLLLLSGSVIFLVWAFPSQILWILGSKYSNLQTALLLNIVGSCLGLITGISFTLYTSRGWAINPLISIPINIVAIIVGALLFHVSTITGVLLLNIWTSVVQVIMNTIYSFYKIWTVESIVEAANNE